MRELAVLSEDAFVISQEVHVTELTLWLACLRELRDVVLLELQVLEFFVDEAVAQVLLIGALSLPFAAPREGEGGAPEAG